METREAFPKKVVALMQESAQQDGARALADVRAALVSRAYEIGRYQQYYGDAKDDQTRVANLTRALGMAPQVTGHMRLDSLGRAVESIMRAASMPVEQE